MQRRMHPHQPVPSIPVEFEMHHPPELGRFGGTVEVEGSAFSLEIALALHSLAHIDGIAHEEKAGDDKRFNGIAGWLISEITFAPGEEKPVMIHFQSGYPSENWSVSINTSESAGLFRYLRTLTSSNGDNRRDVIATVFKGVQNRMVSGYLLRDVINKLNGIHFTSSDELHTLGALYESMLREMRDAAGDSGEFYTPRAVVRFMVTVTDPRLGETVLAGVDRLDDEPLRRQVVDQHRGQFPV